MKSPRLLQCLPETGAIPAAVRSTAHGILLTALLFVPSDAANAEKQAADNSGDEPRTIRIIPRGAPVATASHDEASQNGPKIIPGPTTANPFTRFAQPEQPQQGADSEPTQKTDGSDNDLWNRYGEIYRSIPFNRAEYEANPSYRHEATMEILLGKPRPKIVPPAPKPPRRKAPKTSHLGPPLNYVAPYEVLSPYIHASPHRPFQVYDFSRGPYSRYQGLFGYRGGYRSMYYLRGGYLKSAPR